MGLLIAIAAYLFYGYCTAIVLEALGQTGWWGYVPFLNFVGIVRAAGYSGWLALLVIVPVVNLILHVLAWLKIAHAMGRSNAFAAGLIILPIIFLPLLALDKRSPAPAA